MEKQFSFLHDNNGNSSFPSGISQGHSVIFTNLNEGGIIEGLVGARTSRLTPLVTENPCHTGQVVNYDFHSYSDDQP